jgi:hypothetical protein
MSKDTLYGKQDSEKEKISYRPKTSETLELNLVV